MRWVWLTLGIGFASLALAAPSVQPPQLDEDNRSPCIEPGCENQAFQQAERTMVFTGGTFTGGRFGRAF
jgi:hypothetical protein